MFRKLFGETDEEQLAYLQKKVILTAVCAVLDVAVLIFAHGILFLALCCYYWGWGFIRAYFGITTFPALRRLHGAGHHIRAVAQGII